MCIVVLVSISVEAGKLDWVAAGSGIIILNPAHMSRTLIGLPVILFLRGAEIKFQWSLQIH